MVFRVTVDGGDYAPEVEKSLKDLRRKANVPGFRPGMVPAGVVNKMYGKGVRAEQAYRKANAEVFKHIEEQKLDIMGDVMPSDQQGELSFEDGVASHEFVFEAGIAPAVEVDVEGEKLTRYKIKPTKEMKEGYRARLLRPYGKMEGEKFVEPVIDEELFKTMFPGGDVTDEKGLEKFVDNLIEQDLARESDFLLTLQLKNLILKKAGLKLPEEFLKKWLFAVNEGKFTMEEIEKDFAGFVRMMGWNLVMRHYETKLGLQVTKEDVEAEARAMAAMQFAQYGMRDVPEETLKGFAGTILENREQAQQIFERVREDKVLDAIKPTLKISDKAVSVEEFQKIAGEVND